MIKVQCSIERNTIPRYYYNSFGITVHPNLGAYSTAIFFGAISGVDLGKVTVRIPSFIEAFTSSP
jgi:ABC-type arginine/histidine transport system permease subunit